MGQPTTNDAYNSSNNNNNNNTNPTPTTPTTTSQPTQSSQPTPSTTSTTAPQDQTPSSVDALPPAALDLATKIFDLARAGTTPDLLQYVSAGIPPNMTNHAGDTLLMLAAYHGHAETVQMLLSKGADPNVENDRGQSPIAGAVFKGHDEVVKVLFEGGADAWGGQPSAVDCARMFKREAVLRLFGAEV